MKNLKLIMLGLSLMILAGPVWGQSKKKLKSEIRALYIQIDSLRQANENLLRQNEGLKQQYNAAFREKQTLETELNNMRKENNILQTKYDDLKIAYEQLRVNRPDPLDGNTNPDPTGGYVDNGGDYFNGDNYEDNGGIIPGRGQDDNQGAIPSNLNCFEAQNVLGTNTSYTLDYVPLRKEGFGVQVGSYKDLCKAMDAASTFRRSYNDYETYIHVKDVNSRRYYAVVYGQIMRKGIARDNASRLKRNSAGMGKGAFVIRH